MVTLAPGGPWMGAAPQGLALPLARKRGDREQETGNGKRESPDPYGPLRSAPGRYLPVSRSPSPRFPERERDALDRRAPHGLALPLARNAVTGNRKPETGNGNLRIRTF